MKKLFERKLKDDGNQKDLDDYMKRRNPTPEQNDSALKVLEQLAKISKKKVKIEGEKVTSQPSQIKIGQSFYKGFKCEPGCTACCLNFSLDFLPENLEKFVKGRDRYPFDERKIRVNGKEKSIYTLPDNFDDGECIFLTNYRTDSDEGKGCKFYPTPPLSCLSEPQVKFIYRSDLDTTYLQKRPFGRASQWTNTPQCKFEGEWEKEEDLKILNRFKGWSEYFGIDTAIHELIEGVKDSKRETETVWKKKWKKSKHL